MSGFTPVVLYTDALVYLLVAMVAGTAFYIVRREHLAVPWRRVGHSAAGMAGLTLLLAFIAIGLLDSVHFRPRLEAQPAAAATPASYAVEVLSVLDVVLRPLRERHEKTYSAPLATHSYAMETVSLPDGAQQRAYPRLLYGGAQLADPEHGAGSDIALRALAGAAGGALLGGVCAWLLLRLAGRRWRAVWRGDTVLRWRAVLVTGWVLCALAGAVYALALQYHVLGTDKVGQDVLYQSLKSVRTALVIGTLTTLVTLPFALALGITAGYFGGLIDDVIQYVYTVLNSIPGVLLIAASVLTVQVYIDRHPEWFPTAAQRADIKLFALCVILGVTSWTELCRLLRGETLKLRELEYIQAAHAFGVSHARVILRHILPNTMYLVLISTVVNFSGLVLAEAVLTYVGVGVDPTLNSYGGMINGARLEMARDPMVWWLLASAFVFMVALVLAANLFADAVRDAFDPRVRTRAWKSAPPPRAAGSSKEAA